MIKSIKSGFTLAEVLTTLMVIGVVAAMTIPTLLNSTQDQQSKVAAKKAMSVMTQAVQMFSAREETCRFQNAQVAGPSPTLAACMANVISGTVNDNAINTPDGMVYYFYTPAVAAGTWNLGDICGEDAIGSNAPELAGQDHCGVIADTNGIGKGTKQAPANNIFGANGFDNAVNQLNSATDILNVVFSGSSAKVAIVNGQSNKGNYYLNGTNEVNVGNGVTCYTNPEGEGDAQSCRQRLYAAGTNCADNDDGYINANCNAGN